MMVRITGSLDVKRAALAMAFVSLPFALSGVSLKSQQVSMDWIHRHLYLLSSWSGNECWLESLQGYALRGEGVQMECRSLLKANRRRMILLILSVDMYSDREPCKLKVDLLNQAIGVWRPPGRASSRISIYKGSCIDVGCILPES